MSLDTRLARLEADQFRSVMVILSGLCDRATPEQAAEWYRQVHQQTRNLETKLTPEQRLTIKSLANNGVGGGILRNGG